jgi:5,10-methylene-tetrahydrofolate dehydrogenase/methenyl tetrahydrofolate cyclohydrolase
MNAVSAISILAKLRPVDAKTKLDTLLNKLEKSYAKSRYNFVLRDIPVSAPLRDNGVIETVGYQHMRDTLSQFGNVSDIQIVRGTVYVKFVEQSSCVLCHSMINNMQIGDNIVRTSCLV